MEFIEEYKGLPHKSSSSSKGSNFEDESVFPRKPESSKVCEEVKLVSNFYKFNWNTGGREGMFQYQVETTPPLTCHSGEEKIRMAKIIRELREELKSKLDNFTFWENFIYTFEFVDDEQQLTDFRAVEIDGIEYTMELRHPQHLAYTDEKSIRFFRSFINQFFKKSRMRPASQGRYFDRKFPIELEGVDMYQAYFNSMKVFDSGVYMTLNPGVKFFQHETILHKMRSRKLIIFLTKIYIVMNERIPIKDELWGRSVMTIYNKRIYKIDDIDFEKNPTHKFVMNKHNKFREVSYAEYIKDNYQIEIEDMDQPLIKYYSRELQQDIYLVPEVWVLTGITEQQKGRNFRKIKDQMFANAQTKEKQAKEFFEKIQINENSWYTEITQKWRIELDQARINVTGFWLNEGSIVGKSNGKKLPTTIEELKDKDFSRNFNEPLKTDKIKLFALIYGDSWTSEFETFRNMLKTTVSKDFRFQIKKPIEVKVNNDRNFGNWETAINELLSDNSPEFIIWICPGKFKKWKHYSKLKYFVLNLQTPLPSQIMLNSSCMTGRSLRNICKNLMCQIAAKINHIPWGIEQAPLLNKPTMIVGIDVRNKVGKNKRSVLTFVASIDKYIGRYYTSHLSKGDQQTEHFKLSLLFEQAILKFKEYNSGKTPERIIVYRDAVSEGQSIPVLKEEVPELKKALESLAEEFKEPPNTMFIIANKRIEQRFSTFRRQVHLIILYCFFTKHSYISSNLKIEANSKIQEKASLSTQRYAIQIDLSSTWSLMQDLLVCKLL
jgi:hypothetical protein